MLRNVRAAVIVAAAVAMIGSAAVASADASQPATAKAYWLAHGSPPSPPGHRAPGTPGTLWDNGPANLADGLSSEEDTFTTGTGGPTGEDVSDVSDDFMTTAPTTIGEVRACFLTIASTRAHLYIYSDAAGSPALPVTSPLWGAPTTTDIVTNTSNDNTARCPNNFGLIGREFTFSPATTGVTITLAPGHYWLLVVGDGQGNTSDRDFWATSSPSVPLSDGVWGSPQFVITYWTDVTGFTQSPTPDFAFDIDGQAQPPIPTLSVAGLAALAIALVAFGWYMVRRRSAHAA